MTFNEWWEKNWIPSGMPAAFDAAMRELSAKAWDGAIRECSAIANDQIQTSWNAETDSHNRCAELIRNLVLMRSNADVTGLAPAQENEK